jgi:hypothetical protein
VAEWAEEGKKETFVLHQPTSAADLADRWDIAKEQLDTWVNRAAGEGRIRKLTRPVRYVRKNDNP